MSDKARALKAARQSQRNQHVRIAALESKVRELEAERDSVMSAKITEGCNSTTLELREKIIASRAQVERLVEALEKIKLYRAHNGDTWPADVATEAIAAVEKERHNVEVRGASRLAGEASASTVVLDLNRKGRQ